MCETVVVNLRKSQYDIYIGRPGKGKPGPWGNPVAVGKTCPICSKVHRDGGSTLPCYKKYMWNQVNTNQKFREELWSTCGKRLGCFCKPKPCHGDVIKAWHKAGGPYMDQGVLRHMKDS